MDGQDWTLVTVRRQYNKKEAIQRGHYSIQAKDSTRTERDRLAKLDATDSPLPKKRVAPETLQALIRKRIELKLNQEKADVMCAFPRNTFKDIESKRLIPTEEQVRRIQHNLGVQLKLETPVTSA